MQGGVMDLKERLLKESKVIAVVGLSPNPQRDSHGVAKYLQEQGYRVVPVNPNIEEVLGEKSYPDLTTIPFDVDLVDVFRRSDLVATIVQEAIKIGAKSIWMQDGVVNQEAANLALQAGLDMVMDD